MAVQLDQKIRLLQQVGSIPVGTDLPIIDSAPDFTTPTWLTVATVSRDVLAFNMADVDVVFEVRPVSDPTPPDPPTAVFSWLPLEPVTGEVMTFDATASTGNQLTYAWNFNDGNVTGTGVTFKYAWQYADTHHCTLTVTDSLARTATVSHDITVKEPPPPPPTTPPPPTADFVWSPTTPVVKTPVLFDASKSTGDIADYQWDLNGTVQWTGKTYTYSFNYTNPAHKVTLKVVDSAGQTASVTKSIEVVAASSDPGSTTQATPSFNGSVFGPSGITPYVEASCSRPGNDWGNYCTINGSASSHGPRVVADPAGLARNVIACTTDEAKGSGSVVRCQMMSSRIMKPNNQYWVLSEIYVPSGFPSVPGWLSLASIYAPGGADSGPMTISIRGTNMTWIKEDSQGGARGGTLWSKALTRGVWHVVIRRVLLSTSTSTGWMEIYYAQRGSQATIQTLSAVGGATLTNTNTRRVFATLTSANGTGDQDDRIGNYHADNMSGWSGMNTVYFGNHKIFPGSATLAQVDPFSTGSLT